MSTASINRNARPNDPQRAPVKGIHPREQAVLDELRKRRTGEAAPVRRGLLGWLRGNV